MLLIEKPLYKKAGYGAVARYPAFLYDLKDKSPMMKEYERYEKITRIEAWSREVMNGESLKIQEILSFKNRWNISK